MRWRGGGAPANRLGSSCRVAPILRHGFRSDQALRRGAMRERDAELVVVGGGLAGVAAALEAGEAGIHVLLLEKMDETGGSSAMSSACLAFAGTDLQRAQGIEDSDELLFQDLREVGGVENDERIVGAYRLPQ